MQKRNEVISPYFSEDQYKGQDVVHHGIRIPLKGYYPLDLLVRFSRRAQRIIKLPSQDDTGIRYRAMTNEDLPVLRSMWFDPSDSTFPIDLKHHTGVTARLGDEIIGGAIWARQGASLFLHQLVAGQKGKDLQLPTLLVWQSVVMYHGHDWHSLDIGVSYNPKRYEFFKNFEVETYPIILKKPFYTPVIRLSPFRSFVDLKETPDAPDYAKMNCTFVPRGNYAMLAALKHLGIGVGDQVMIIKTFGSNFITGCVTQTIERTGATWSLRQRQSNTKAVIAIHEFGIPVYQEQDIELIAWAQEHKIPVIEDCAWRSEPVWKESEYQVFSLQKMANLNYGGVLRGVHLDDETLWKYGCLDVVKRGRMALEADQDEGVVKRVDNWFYYHHLVQADGMSPDDCYDYSEAILNKKWVPTVYLQKFESDEVADAIVQRLEQFGIQAGHYWGEPVVYLPIHQNMSTAEVEYMFAVVRGYFNLCRDYRGTLSTEVNHDQS